MSPVELRRCQALLTDAPRPRHDNKAAPPSSDELEMAPLVWWDVKTKLDQMYAPLKQYAVLGHLPSTSSEPEDRSNGNAIATQSSEEVLNKPVLLNTNSPWSAFLCGSQGSGKSHTLSCMLENCVLTNPSQIKQIGKNPNPLAGLVFHYDACDGGSTGICEAAYLCDKVPVKVLVSGSNLGKLKARYEDLAKKVQGKIEVQRLWVLPKYLDTERVKTLMAVGKDGDMPLYMQTIMRILREMAMESGGIRAFDYAEFRRKLDGTAWVMGQQGPMDMRLDLLESMMKKERVQETPHALTNQRGGGRSGRGGTHRGNRRRSGGGSNPESSSYTIIPNLENDHLTGRPGTLTIIDLTDPVIDPDSACVLFNICLSVFISQTQSCGKVVALDEAHVYMKDESAAAKAFTERLLRTVREQRHVATRIIIATQEPTINSALLDLCSITMVHRCTSPAWFVMLKKHIAALELNGLVQENGDTENASVDKEVFEKIVKLKLGESLLFCPTAVLAVDATGLERMNARMVKFKTRRRVTADGGRSKMAECRTRLA